MVWFSRNFPVSSTTAILHPVLCPGSIPITPIGPAGGASSRVRRFSSKTLIASDSARSRSIDRTSFRDDVQGAFDGRFDDGKFFFRTDELLREYSGRLLARLIPDILRERFEASLQSHAGLSFALELVRKIQVFELVPAVTGDNLRLQFIGKLALPLNRAQNSRAAIFQIGVVLPPLVDVPDLDLVKIPGSLLAI